MQYPNSPVDNEKLSQLMDGEWHELNPSDCVAGICSDEALRAKWTRYHLIRDAMNNEPVQSDLNLASRICDAIADEPEYSNITPFSPAGGESAPMNAEQSGASETVVGESSASMSTNNTSDTEATRRKPSWLGTGATGFALAASVAVVTVVGMNIWQGQTIPSDDPSVVASRAVSGIDGADAFSRQVEGAPLPVVEFVANTGSYWVSPQTAERVTNEEKLNMFLSQHIENSPTSSREGLLPYSRLVGYDEQVQDR